MMKNDNFELMASQSLVKAEIKCFKSMFIVSVSYTNDFSYSQSLEIRMGTEIDWLNVLSHSEIMLHNVKADIDTNLTLIILS